VAALTFVPVDHSPRTAELIASFVRERERTAA
jgi:hypothetical protein